MKEIYAKKEIAKFKASLNRYFKAIDSAIKAGDGQCKNLAFNSIDLRKTFRVAREIILQLEKK